MIHDEWRHRARAADDLLSDIAAVCRGEMPAEAREGGSEAQHAAWNAVCALRVEVERLRDTVAFLRACVPPTRPTDYGHEVWTAALREAEAKGRREERKRNAAIIAGGHIRRGGYTALAHEIERGEHRREENE